MLRLVSTEGSRLVCPPVLDMDQPKDFGPGGTESFRRPFQGPHLSADSEAEKIE